MSSSSVDASIWLSSVQRQVETAVDRLTERPYSEVTQRDPELEGAARASELQAEVREVDLAIDRLDVLEVGRRDFEAVS